MSRGSQLRVSGVLLLLAVAGRGIFALRHLGEWLELDEPLRPSKAIVVMGGDSGDPAHARIGLDPDSEPDISHLILSKLGLPTANA